MRFAGVERPVFWRRRLFGGERNPSSASSVPTAAHNLQLTSRDFQEVVGLLKHFSVHFTLIDRNLSIINMLHGP